MKNSTNSYLFALAMAMAMAMAMAVSAALLAQATQAHQDSGEDPVAQEIHELLDAFLAGASTNDIEMHDRFWAEDLVYTSSTGERRGKAETMAGLRAAAPADAEDLPTYRGEDVNIRLFDDLAVVTFRLIAEMPDETIGEYFNTGVFARRDGQWRAFTWQATRIPSEPSD